MVLVTVPVLLVVIELVVLLDADGEFEGSALLDTDLVIDTESVIDDESEIDLLGVCVIPSRDTEIDGVNDFDGVRVDETVKPSVGLCEGV